jgi:hypothetical protein
MSSFPDLPPFRKWREQALRAKRELLAPHTSDIENLPYEVAQKVAVQEQLALKHRAFSFLIFLICAIVALVLILSVVDVPSTPARLEVTTSAARFKVSDRLTVTHSARVGQVRFGGPVEIRGSGDLPIVGPEGFLSRGTAESPSLELIALPPDASVEISGGGRNWDLRIHTPVTADVQFSYLPKSFDNGKVDSAVAIVSFDGEFSISELSLEDGFSLTNIPATEIDFVEAVPSTIKVTEVPGQEKVMSSPILTGEIVFPAISDKKQEVGRGDALTVEAQGFRITHLDLSKSGISLGFQCNASAITAGIPGYSRNLMPSMLEWAASSKFLNVVYAVVSAIIVLALTIVGTIR